MRIGINARYLQNIESTLGQYVSRLLSKLKEVDKSNEYILFLGSGKPVIDDTIKSSFLYDVSKMPTTNQILKIAWQHLYVPLRIKNLRIDIFHEPNFITPFFKQCPTLTTIHDLANKFLPHCYTFRNRLYIERLIKRSIAMADKIIAVSENTKKDILANYKVKEQKVEVVYLGIDKIFCPLNDLKEEHAVRLESKYGIRGDFILAVSLISPRKNLTSLIRAFISLRQKGKISHQLVIAGKKGWLFEEVFKEAHNSSYKQDIIFCDFVPQDDLVMLYNRADVFVYPSLYEGFGVPPLEAMACDCPVVASNVSSIPEICSGAAFLIDPYDTSAIADAIFRVLSDTALKKSLIERGRIRSSFFSWRRTAEKMVDVYKNTL